MSHEPQRQAGVGHRDQPDALWAPHRMAYTRGQDKAADSSVEECPFCRIPTLPVEDGLMVWRGELAYAVLNLYPYAPGHLMICPYRHIADYTDTTADEAEEMTLLTKAAIRVLR